MPLLHGRIQGKMELMKKYQQKLFDTALLAELTNAGIKLHDDFAMITAGEIEEQDRLLLARYTSGALIWFPIASFTPCRISKLKPKHFEPGPEPEI